MTPPGVGTQRLSGLVPKRNNEPTQHKRRSELRAVVEAMGPGGSENPGGRNIEPPPAYDDPRLRAAESASPALERATVAAESASPALERATVGPPPAYRPVEDRVNVSVEDRLYPDLRLSAEYADMGLESPEGEGAPDEVKGHRETASAAAPASRGDAGEEKRKEIAGGREGAAPQIAAAPASRGDGGEEIPEEIAGGREGAAPQAAGDLDMRGRDEAAPSSADASGRQAGVEREGSPEPRGAEEGTERLGEEPSGFTPETLQQRFREWVRKNLTTRRKKVAPIPPYMAEGLDTRRAIGELGSDPSPQDSESSESEAESPPRPPYRPSRSYFGAVFGGSKRRTQSSERRDHEETGRPGSRDDQRPLEPEPGSWAQQSRNIQVARGVLAQWAGVQDPVAWPPPPTGEQLKFLWEVGSNPSGWPDLDRDLWERYRMEYDPLVSHLEELVSLLDQSLGPRERRPAGLTKDELLLARMGALEKVRWLKRLFDDPSRRPPLQQKDTSEEDGGGQLPPLEEPSSGDTSPAGEGSAPRERERFQGYSNASERSRTEQEHLRAGMARTGVGGDDPGDPGGGPPSRCPRCGRFHPLGACPFSGAGARRKWCPICQRYGLHDWKECPSRPGAPTCLFCHRYHRERPLECPFRPPEPGPAGLPLPPQDQRRFFFHNINLRPPAKPLPEVREPNTGPPAIDPRDEEIRQGVRQEGWEQAWQQLRVRESLLRDQKARWDWAAAEATRELKGIFGPLSPEDNRALRDALIRARIQATCRPTPSAGSDREALDRLLGVPDIPTFDGDNSKTHVWAFLQKLERAMEGRGWTHEEKARLCRSRLRGRARDWLENWRSRDSESVVVTHYPSLKGALLQCFQEEMTALEGTDRLLGLVFHAGRHKTHLNFLLECEYTVWRVLSEGPTQSPEVMERGRIFEKILMMFFLRGCDPAVRAWVTEKGCDRLRDLERALRSYESGRLNGPQKGQAVVQGGGGSRAGQPAFPPMNGQRGRILPGPQNKWEGSQPS